MTPLSPTLQAALASLGPETAGLRSRSMVVDPVTGASRTVTLEAGLWRLLDQLAQERRTTPDSLCRPALQGFAEADPALVVRALLRHAILGA